MGTTYGGDWWAVLLRGVAAILFGIAALIWPKITLFVLIALFGVFVFVEGVFTIVQSFRRTERGGSFWAQMAKGIIGILVGIGVFLWPGMTGIILLYIIAFWAIATGALEIIAGIQLRDQINYEWWLVASGVISFVFGLLIAIFPGAGALALVVYIGIYALIIGVVLVATSFQIRSGPPRAV